MRWILILWLGQFFDVISFDTQLGCEQALGELHPIVGLPASRPDWIDGEGGLKCVGIWDSDEAPIVTEIISCVHGITETSNGPECT